MSRNNAAIMGSASAKSGSDIDVGEGIVPSDRQLIVAFFSNPTDKDVDFSKYETEALRKKVKDVDESSGIFGKALDTIRNWRSDKKEEERTQSPYNQKKSSEEDCEIKDITSSLLRTPKFLRKDDIDGIRKDVEGLRKEIKEKKFDSSDILKSEEENQTDNEKRSVVSKILGTPDPIQDESDELKVYPFSKSDSCEQSFKPYCSPHLEHKQVTVAPSPRSFTFNPSPKSMIRKAAGTPELVAKPITKTPLKNKPVYGTSILRPRKESSTITVHQPYVPDNWVTQNKPFLLAPPVFKIQQASPPTKNQVLPQGIRSPRCRRSASADTRGTWMRMSYPTQAYQIVSKKRS